MRRLLIYSCFFVLCVFVSVCQTEAPRPVINSCFLLYNSYESYCQPTSMLTFVMLWGEHTKSHHFFHIYWAVCGRKDVKMVSLFSKVCELSVNLWKFFVFNVIIDYWIYIYIYIYIRAVNRLKNLIAINRMIAMS